jgi:histone H3/H4
MADKSVVKKVVKVDVVKVKADVVKKDDTVKVKADVVKKDDTVKVKADVVKVKADTVKVKVDTVKKDDVVKDDDKKSSRQQISKLIGINLSVSRVRKHVDKNNVNADIETACNELKSLLALETEGKTVDLNTLSNNTKLLVERAYSQIYDVRKNKYDVLKERLSVSKVANDIKKLNAMEAFSVKTETLSEKIDYVSKLRCRFSNDASVVLSSALDYVIQDLVRTAMVRARSLGKAIIQVQHIVKDDFKSVCMYPLVHQLDVVQKALSTADHVGDIVDGEECDDEKVDVHDDDDDDKHGSTFEFYINLICKNVKNKLVESDESYASIRISKHIRKFCSDIVIQLIERLSPLIKLYAATAKVKTVNDDVIKFIFKFLLLDAGKCPDQFYTFMQERLNIYRNIKSVDK